MPVRKTTIQFWLLILVAFLLAEALQAGPSLLTTNNIHSIVTNGNAVIIRVVAPAGTNQVTLQTQAANSAGAWKPVAVQRKTGGEKELVFRVPKSMASVSYRATIGPVPLPAKFYHGRAAFAPARGSSSSLALVGGTLATPVGLSDGEGLPTPTATTPESGTQSDIWSIDGNRLYFFNQDRGLESFDISNPDSPALLGTLGLPASGEQMYVLDSNHVLLLTQDCSGGNSVLAYVDVSSATPTLVTNIPLGGYISDSRQVGTSVYLAYNNYNSITNYTEITSYDFSNPSAPSSVTNLTLANANNILTVSGGYLLAVSPDGTNGLASDVACIDISAGQGTMTLDAVLTTSAVVPDQFALNVSSNILTTVSVQSSYYNYGPSSATYVENFALNETSAPRIGSLFMSDQYYETARFDSNRLYISEPFYDAWITIVDLTDPTAPAWVYDAEFPTVYPPGLPALMYPVGNQVVSIGNDMNGTTWVWVFDVSHEAQPELLNSVNLGTNFTWSEAESDPQAFTVIPEAGLIMVPYQTFNANGGSTSGIQLIDLNSNGLALRGVIPDAQARRATLFNNRVISVSDTALVSANIANQDNPVITAQLELSWPVDQVFLSGNYVVELSSGVWEGGSPILTVASAASPDVGLTQWTLTNSTVLGATEQSGFLYLLEGTQPTNYTGLLSVLDPATSETNQTVLTMTIIDLSALPALTIAGETNFVVNQPVNAGAQAVWPTNGTLVWVASGQQEWFWPLANSLAKLPSPVTTASRAAKRHPSAKSKASTAALPLLPWFYGSGGIQLLAFDVTDSANPAPVSTTVVGTNGWPAGDAVFTTDGLVYVSHAVWNNVLPPGDAVVPSPKSANTYVFLETSELDVVDFTAPSAPVVRDEVQIPGALAGIGQGGNILYTVDFNGAVDALAYDGVSAFLVATLPAPKDGFQETLVANDTVFTAQATSKNGTSSELIAWSLNAAGKFVKADTIPFSQWIYGLANFGNLLAVQNGSGITLVDFTQPTNLATVGGGSANNCIWLGLTGADGALGSGLWVPLGDYGVFRLPTSTP